MPFFVDEIYQALMENQLHFNIFLLFVLNKVLKNCGKSSHFQMMKFLMFFFYLSLFHFVLCFFFVSLYLLLRTFATVLCVWAWISTFHLSISTSIFMPFLLVYHCHVGCASISMNTKFNGIKTHTAIY